MRCFGWWSPRELLSKHGVELNPKFLDHTSLNGEALSDSDVGSADMASLFAEGTADDFLYEEME